MFDKKYLCLLAIKNHLEFSEFDLKDALKVINSISMDNLEAFQTQIIEEINEYAYKIKQDTMKLKGLALEIKELIKCGLEND